MTKTPTQLDREIAEILSGESKRIPGWDLMSGAERAAVDARIGVALRAAVSSTVAPAHPGGSPVTAGGSASASDAVSQDTSTAPSWSHPAASP